MKVEVIDVDWKGLGVGTSLGKLVLQFSEVSDQMIITRTRFLLFAIYFQGDSRYDRTVCSRPFQERFLWEYGK